MRERTQAGGSANPAEGHNSVLCGLRFYSLLREAEREWRLKKKKKQTTNPIQKQQFKKAPQTNKKLAKVVWEELNGA